MADRGAAKDPVDWRRVSSTHELEDLVGLTAPAKHEAGGLLFLRGALLVAAGLAFGIGSIWWILSPSSVDNNQCGGKVLGPFGNEAAGGERATFDASTFYSLLVPLTIPMAIIFVIFHWISMKFFKHAYS